MDDVFAQLAMNTATFLGKAAFGAASSLAVKHVSTYIKARENSHSTGGVGAEEEKTELLLTLERKLKQRIVILTPIIDLIDMAGTKSNSLFTNCHEIIAQLRQAIESFTLCVASAASEVAPSSKNSLSIEEESLLAEITRRLSLGGSGKKDSGYSTPAQSDNANIARRMEKLIAQMDDILPYLQLVISISGLKFSGNLCDSNVSPSRVLGASRVLCEGERMSDAESSQDKYRPIWGPVPVKVYSLFYGSVRVKSAIQWTWKEEYPAAYFTLRRSGTKPLSYRLALNRYNSDNLYHESDGQNDSIEINIEDVQKTFFSNAGRLLKIEDSDSPCIILKISNNSCKNISKVTVRGDDYAPETPSKQSRAKTAIPTTPLTQKNFESSCDELWYAIEHHDFTNNENSVESDDGEESETSSISSAVTATDDTLPAEQECKDREKIKSSIQSNMSPTPSTQSAGPEAISMLDYLIKLCALETSKQISHTQASDEVLMQALGN